MGRSVVLAVILFCCNGQGTAADAPRDFKDVVYATVGGTALALDVHLPQGVRKPPLVVFVHGGAWTTGNKGPYPAFLVDRGFAVASLDFRSSNDAQFPADVHDIKAGIRFLRAKASEYGYRADRIATHSPAMTTNEDGRPTKKPQPRGSGLRSSLRPFSGCFNVAASRSAQSNRHGTRPT